MRKYIEDLTNNLIGSHCFYELWDRLKTEPDQFVRMVSLMLLSTDIDEMCPETLGKIMCSLEIGDVGTGKLNVGFQGDPDLFLRQIVSEFLALLICERLNPGTGNPYKITPYLRKP